MIAAERETVATGTAADEQKKAAADRLRAAREASRWGSEKED